MTVTSPINSNWLRQPLAGVDEDAVELLGRALVGRPHRRDEVEAAGVATDARRRVIGSAVKRSGGSSPGASSESVRRRSASSRVLWNGRTTAPAPIRAVASRDSRASSSAPMTKSDTGASSTPVSSPLRNWSNQRSCMSSTTSGPQPSLVRLAGAQRHGSRGPTISFWPARAASDPPSVRMPRKFFTDPERKMSYQPAMCSAGMVRRL